MISIILLGLLIITDTQLVEFYSPKNILIRDLRKDEKVYKYNNTRGYSFRVSQRHRLALKNKYGELAENIDSFLRKKTYLMLKVLVLR